MINEVVAPLPLPMGSGVSNDELHVRMQRKVEFPSGFEQVITNT